MSERRLIQISHVSSEKKYQAVAARQWNEQAVPGGVYQAEKTRGTGSELANQTGVGQTNPANQRATTPSPTPIPSSCSKLPLCAYAFHSLIIGSKLPGSTRLLMCASLFIQIPICRYPYSGGQNNTNCLVAIYKTFYTTLFGSLHCPVIEIKEAVII